MSQLAGCAARTPNPFRTTGAHGAPYAKVQR